MPSICRSKVIKDFSHQKKITYAEATKQIKVTNPCPNLENQIVVAENNSEEQIVSKVFKTIQSKNQEEIVNKIVEVVQTQTKENEEENIEKISDKIILQTREYQNELMDDIIRRTENCCKCKIPPEGLLIFIITAIKYFKEEQFLTKSSEKQFSLLIHIFEKCTKTHINQVHSSHS